MEQNVRDGPLPWYELLEQLLERKGVSQEDLAYKARAAGGPKISSSSISKVRRGTRPLRMDFLEAIATALEMPPEIFVEYRLASMRRLFDERELGLEVTSAHLQQLAEMQARHRDLTADNVDPDAEARRAVYERAAEARESAMLEEALEDLVDAEIAAAEERPQEPETDPEESAARPSSREVA